MYRSYIFAATIACASAVVIKSEAEAEFLNSNYFDLVGISDDPSPQESFDSGNFRGLPFMW